MNATAQGIVPRARAGAGALVDVVFPRWCAGCGGLVPPGDFKHLCADCVADIEFIRAPHCSTCGWPFFGAVEGARKCPHCEELDPVYGEGRAGLLVRGPARVFLHELKYRGGLHLRGDVRALARRCAAILEFVRGATLVPVPLFPGRARWRGFNQARAVADALAAEGGAAGIEELLERMRDTPTQTRLDRAARERNMRGAFAAKRGAKISADTRYVVVDDVFTTGATLNACARALRQAGARRLDVATLGHG